MNIKNTGKLIVLVGAAIALAASLINDKKVKNAVEDEKR